ncbi:tripartite tricarboxylate transporter permease (plasmid) [Sinorhizobium meliloti WSM1022]|uniref:tripartite tricarboxylate transporter permease n=1 Tax=Rhizobium meliloti TaxID=382 RepID=UPI000400D5D4|nr:tripartite tricarboxylate transporter permease [Sinorhizobium meliloti]MDE3819664.1 tripartite tricarboxylate transporter permease [Sinorhizobium meliloti]MDE3831402.1 tripartite tricarboxylate transporter permease [Sinorhizobium meliloti]MDE4579085.1 tripartite tricarboxylate transporter permease [Sinorhizobium meliloti]MDW9627785.1 tripartite tricarboxylate transporter permease [Sinorhizobium meliloti]MDW9714045.1 tripartite tricarboxylate transporter permease [Sinorhizobium meliloti]
MFDTIIYGFTLAGTWQNLGFAFVGCLLGTLIGVLPGVGPLATVSMLLSMTIYLDPLSSLVMLAGIFYGAQYGGSTTAILCNLPGEASAVVTVLDGHQMARKGRAGAALAVAALGSLFAGICATLVIALFAPILSNFALRFNAPEYFALMLLGLMAAVVFSGAGLVKALAMAALGILLGTVGTDVETGAARFTFGMPELSEGIGIVALSMGLFGLSEIIMNVSNAESREVMNANLGKLWPSREEARRAAPAAARGTVVGSLLGVLPGGGVVLSTFVAYMLEQKISRRPQEFGKGAVEGLAAPEAANNAAAQTSFIPLLTLGIPTTPTLALMLGAMIMQGIQPGPEVMATRPDLFWGLIASMLIGNVMLVIINLPLIGLWVQLLRVPYRILFPVILTICCIGAYSLEFSMVDLLALSAFAGGGVLLVAFGFPPVPLLLGFILGPLAEENLRRAMAISGGDASVFFTRPISATIVLMIVALVLVVVMPTFKRNRAVFEEQ